MSADLAEVDLEAIRARAEATTPGPWITHRMGNIFVGPGNPGSLREIVHMSADDLNTLTVDAAAREAIIAEFIAHARTDVPALLAEVESLRARLYDVQAYLAKTLDNVEGIESGWTAAEAREFITDALAMAGVSSQELPTGPESWGTYTCVHCVLTATGTIHDAGSNRGKQRCGTESGLPYGHNAHPANVPCDNPWTACIGSLTPSAGEPR